MPIVAGSVTIDDEGTAAGTGLALALANAKLDAFSDDLPTDENALASVYVGIAADCNATALALVTYLLDNAEPIVDGVTGTLT
jgi:hypothetical protein